MRDSTSVTDSVSITLVRGPSTFIVIRPLESIPLDFEPPFPMFRYDMHAQFYITAMTQDEAEQLLTDTINQVNE